MASINTLIPDIYELMGRKDGWFTEELASILSTDIARRLRAQLNEERSAAATIRMSKLGPQCPCALWHSIHLPGLAEPLPPWAEIKFSYGHISEAFLISLIKASGHTVTGEQDEVTVDGVRGHRDCVVDGCIVDVKSCSSRAFIKFKDKSIGQDDSFGYLDQMDGYLVGSYDDPLVTVKDKGYFLAIDKTLGKLCLYEHTVREEHIRKRIASHKRISGLSECPPCECGTVPEGKSGNIKLDVKASYSSFKFCCKPHLRTFLYASGPVYLTEVKRKPDVTEIDRQGKIVYH